MDLRKTAYAIGNTINTLGCLKIDHAGTGRDYVGFRCTTTDSKFWKVLRANFLVNAKGFSSHICHRFIGSQGKEVSFWYLQFRADNLPSVEHRIIEQLLRAKVAAEQVTAKRKPRDLKPVSISEPGEAQDTRPAFPAKPRKRKKTNNRPQGRKFELKRCTKSTPHGPVTVTTIPILRGGNAAPSEPGARGATPVTDDNWTNRP